MLYTILHTSIKAFKIVRCSERCQLSLRGAVLRANKNTIVRTAVIICVSLYNVPHHFITTLRVHAIIGALCENISARL